MKKIKATWGGLGLYLLFCGLFLNAGAQNLVPNPGFEDTIACPTGLHQLDSALGWTKPNLGTSDYYNACAPAATNVGIPVSVGGIQIPHTGDGMAGLVTFVESVFTDTCREYAQAQLVQPLQAGVTYHIALAVGVPDAWTIFGNQIHMAFSTVPFSQPNSDRLPLLPDVVLQQNNFSWLQDTSWVVLDTEYTATGTEQYLIIGNFFTDANTDTLFIFNGQDPQTYYYIDDVCITPAGQSVSLGNDTTLCAAPLILQPSPVPAPGATFLWSTGGTGPMDTVTQSGTYWVEVTYGPTCPVMRDTIVVTMENPPFAGVDTALAACLDTLPVDLLNLIGGNAGGAWSPPLSGGNTWDPAQDSVGVYTYTVPGTMHCPDDSAVVTINNDIVVSLGPDTALCGGSYALQVSPVPGPGATILWSTGDTTTGIVVTQSGAYWVEVGFGQACLPGRDTVAVTLEAQGNAGVDTTLLACPGDGPTDLLALTGGDSGGNWMPALSGGNSWDPAADPDGTFLYVLAADSVCMDDSATVTVDLQVFDPTISGPDTLCRNADSVQFASVMQGGTWSGQGITDSLSGAYDPALVAGQVDSIIYTGPAHCFEADTFLVHIREVPNPNLGPDIGYCIPPLVLQVEGGPFLSYAWNTGQTSDTLDVPREGLYAITVSDIAGCAGTDTIIVTYDCEELEIPNVFSPNNDGINDEFRVTGSMEGFEVRIFDRWGNQVHTSRTPLAAWDGKLAEGGDAPEGVYYYVIQLDHYYNGALKHQAVSGALTLMR